MKSRWHLVAILFFALSLLYNAWIWGGLARDPEVGAIVTAATQREVSFAGLYRPLGSLLLRTESLRQAAQAAASSRFVDLLPHLKANPQAAMQTLVEGMPATVQASYYGTPVLLLVSAVLWWMRPRGVHMVSKR